MSKKENCKNKMKTEDQFCNNNDIKFSEESLNDVEINKKDQNFNDYESKEKNYIKDNFDKCENFDKSKNKTEDNVEKLTKLNEQLNSKYFSSLAELENLRKRLNREKTQSLMFQRGEIILNFLSPIDDFNNALTMAKKSSDEAVKMWAIGFEMLYLKFEEVLLSFSVKKFESLGKPFNPKFHDATEVISDDTCDDGVIMKELSPGYLIGDRILKPASVVVCEKHKKREICKDIEKNKENKNESK